VAVVIINENKFTMKELYIIMLCLIVENICGIIVNLILLILSPIYLLGILFWDNKTAYSLIQDYEKKLAKLSLKDDPKEGG